MEHPVVMNISANGVAVVGLLFRVFSYQQLAETKN